MFSFINMVGFLNVIVFLSFSNIKVSGIEVDGLKILKCDRKDGVNYVNFVLYKFSFLDLLFLLLVFVSMVGECGVMCVDNLLCFFFNCVVFLDNVYRKMFCKFLFSDKYNKLSKFFLSLIFYYYSIKVCREILLNFFFLYNFLVGIYIV